MTRCEAGGSVGFWAVAAIERESVAVRMKIRWLLGIIAAVYALLRHCDVTVVSEIAC